MKHAHIALALAIAASSAAALARPALEFKGVRFGVGDAQAVEDVVRSGPGFGWNCSGSAEAGDERCMAHGSTFANEFCPSIGFTFDAGKLSAVYIKTTPGGFPGIVAALSLKYGPPSTRTGGTVRNAMNATFPQSVLTWNLKGAGSIVATLRDDRIDESSIVMTSDAAVAAFNRKRAAEKATKKPDI